MMKELSIDLETYSDIDISKCGAYKYAESDNFEMQSGRRGQINVLIV